VYSQIKCRSCLTADGRNNVQGNHTPMNSEAKHRALGQRKDIAIDNIQSHAGDMTLELVIFFSKPTTLLFVAIQNGDEGGL
jgi:hypothetical protein